MEIVARDHARLTDIAGARLGRTPTRIESMAAGLGHRRFHRIHFASGEPRTLVARIEPSPDEIPSPLEPTPPDWLPEPALEPFRTFLELAGLPVPASALHLPDEGVDLLEDLGSTCLLDLDREAAKARCPEACALVARLQRLAASPDEIPAFGRRYDRRLIQTKAWKWLHWTIPLLLDRPARTDEVRATTALFEHIASLAESAPLRLAHRDFKAENLHLVARGDALSTSLVMIDIQGAFLAPPEYDLVCLLYDLQIGWQDDVARLWLEAILPELPDAPEPTVALERFDALAIARVCKDVSHLVHAALVGGDRRRWAEVPTGLELIARAVGRREHTFPGARVLSSVIQSLTGALQSTDSAGRE